MPIHMGEEQEKELGKELKKEKSGKVHFIVINFVRIMLALALVGAIFHERLLVAMVAVIALIVTFLPTIFDRLWNIKIPAGFEVMTLLFIYGTLFFGEVRGFYAKFWWWDILLTFGASLALGFVGLTILYVLYKDEKIDASPLIIAIFTFCFALAAGTMWEIFEYTVDHLFAFQLQKGSLLDTMKDIIVNAVGAFVVAFTGYFYIRDGQIIFVSKLISVFVEKNPMIFRAKKKETPEEELDKLIKKGENEKLEFKSTLRINLHTNEVDKKIEHAFLKTLVAYMNSDGGTLLVGVKDNSEIIGVEQEGFTNHDKLHLHVTNLIKNTIGKEYFHLLHFDLIPIQGKHVLKIESKKSEKPVFLKGYDQEEFYIRNGPSSGKLSGSALLEYVERRFKSNNNY